MFFLFLAFVCLEYVRCLYVYNKADMVTIEDVGRFINLPLFDFRRSQPFERETFTGSQIGSPIRLTVLSFLAICHSTWIGYLTAFGTTSG